MADIEVPQKRSVDGSKCKEDCPFLQEIKDARSAKGFGLEVGNVFCSNFGNVQDGGILKFISLLEFDEEYMLYDRDVLCLRYKEE